MTQKGTIDDAAKPRKTDPFVRIPSGTHVDVSIEQGKQYHIIGINAPRTAPAQMTFSGFLDAVFEERIRVVSTKVSGVQNTDHGGWFFYKSDATITYKSP